MFLGSDIIFKFSNQVILSLGHAYFRALNRKDSQVSTEDLLVGLCSALGDLALGFFESPQAVKAEVAEISDQYEHRFGVFHFPARAEGGVERDSEGREVAYAGPILQPSQELGGIMEAAERISKSRSKVQVELDDLMSAFAESDSARSLEKEKGIRFKSA